LIPTHSSGPSTKTKLVDQPEQLPSPAQILSSEPFTRQEVTLLENLDKYVDDCWGFLTGSLYTMDSVDLEQPVKRFPDWPYLKALVDLWLHEQIVIVWKPRRMVITWTMLSCQLWLAMLRPFVRSYVGAKKAEDSDALLDNIRFMYEHIPLSVFPVLPKATKTENLIDFPGINSKIIGVPQGGEQLRQHTATSVFYDEFAFWEEAQASWQATLPTLVGGGKICVVSTTAAGFFEDLVKGRLGEEDRLWEKEIGIEQTYADKDFTALRTVL